MFYVFLIIILVISFIITLNSLFFTRKIIEQNSSYNILDTVDFSNNEIDINAPVEFLKYSIIEYNNGLLGFNVYLRNLNYGILNAIKLEIVGYDSFDKIIKVGDKDSFEFLSQDLNIEPGREFSSVSPTLLPNNIIRKLKITVKQAKFSDGTIINNDNPKLVEVNNIIKNKEELKIARGILSNAICYPTQQGNYWICACGRPNDNNIEKCVRCDSEKTFIFKNLNKEIISEKLQIKKKEDKEKWVIQEKKNKRQTVIAIALIIVIVFCAGGFIYDRSQQEQKSRSEQLKLEQQLAEKRKELQLEKTICIKGDMTSDSIALAGIKSDGTIVGMGNIYLSSFEWKDIVSVSASNKNIIGLKKDGTVVLYYSMGYNGSFKKWSNIVEVAVGYNHAVGLKMDGTVVADGENKYNYHNVSDWKDVIAIAAGTNFTIGLKKDGTVLTAGAIENLSSWKEISKVSAGYYYAAGIRKDGTVITNDPKTFTNVYKWRDIKDISFDVDSSYIIGIKTDGTVIYDGYNDTELNKIYKWKDIVSIAAADYNIFGLKEDGTVVSVSKYYSNTIDTSKLKDIKIPG